MALKQWGTSTGERGMPTMKRRDFLSNSMLAAGGALLASQATFAHAESAGASRLVLVILRGALDGLSAVPPYGDADYASLRRELALKAPGTPDGALKLDSLFGLHPKLSFLHESFSARELVVFHAVASPYRDRSHFDGQDVLESGHLRPHTAQTGWLNRALAQLPAKHGAKPLDKGVALGQNVPLVMRGPAAVSSWSPSRLAALDDDTLDRIADLYANDPLLSKRLADALQTNSIAQGGEGNDPDGEAMSDDPKQSLVARREKRIAGSAARYEEIAQAAGGFLRREEGPQVAVFDTTGWDTHANEGDEQGQLAQRLGALDTGLRNLKKQMGSAWRNTAVLLVTEFGRTAAVNGTRGTDHGTGSAAFLLGGAVNGGRVIADWPGLSASALYQNRDLKPTLDLRSVIKGVLADHLAVPARALDNSVFPDSEAVRPMRDLIRA
jgi:uncharacterized protein (DUF1501 family)